MTPVNAWCDVLDELESFVAAQQNAVDEGRHAEMPSFVPPVGLSPLPEDLAQRAELLLARMSSLEEQLRRGVADVATQRALVQRCRVAERLPGQVNRVL